MCGFGLSSLAFCALVSRKETVKWIDDGDDDDEQVQELALSAGWRSLLQLAILLPVPRMQMSTAQACGPFAATATERKTFSNSWKETSPKAEALDCSQKRRAGI
jgi:hypothetical protein